MIGTFESAQSVLTMAVTGERKDKSPYELYLITHAWSKKKASYLRKLQTAVWTCRQSLSMKFLQSDKSKIRDELHVICRQFLKHKISGRLYPIVFISSFKTKGSVDNFWNVADILLFFCLELGMGG